MALFTRSKAADARRRVDTPPETPSEGGVAIDPVDPVLEAQLQELGRAFLEQSRKHRVGLLSTAFWSDKLMDWAMKDEAFKVQLFRFVDTFPMLTHARAGARPPRGLPHAAGRDAAARAWTWASRRAGWPRAR